jgi:hypothetical protein
MVAAAITFSRLYFHGPVFYFPLRFPVRDFVLSGIQWTYRWHNMDGI